MQGIIIPNAPANITLKNCTFSPELAQSLAASRKLAHNQWAWRRTQEAIAKGENLCDRLAFWSEIPFCGHILKRLADDLDLASEEVEFYGSAIQR